MGANTHTHTSAESRVGPDFYIVHTRRLLDVLLNDYFYEKALLTSTESRAGRTSRYMETGALDPAAMCPA